MTFETATNLEINQSPFLCNFFYSKDNLKIRYGIGKSLASPSKGIVLLLHGRSEFIEKYNDIAAILISKKYDVVSMDWRGQGLSGRELGNRQKGYVKNFDDYIQDLKILYENFIKDKNLPVYILAHSMGGHIGLRFMHNHPKAIKKAVLASPMIDIAIPPFLKVFSKFFAQKACNAGFDKNYILGGKDYSASIAKFKRNRLSHDSEKFWILHNEIKKNPDLAIGGVTWGWLHAAFESIKIIKSKNFVRAIETPFLMISAKKDFYVSFTAQKKFCQSIPSASFVPVPGAFHELMFEEMKINKLFWKYFDEFIKD